MGVIPEHDEARLRVKLLMLNAQTSVLSAWLALVKKRSMAVDSATAAALSALRGLGSMASLVRADCCFHCR